jgi:hypothetical protein
MRLGLFAQLLISGSLLIRAGQQAPITTFGTTVFSSAGLIGRIYFIPDGATALPRFEELHPAGVIYTPSLNVPPQRWSVGFPGVTERFEWFAIDYRGNFWIDKAGMYRFSLTSDDGACLSIDDQQIIDNDGQHPPETRFANLELKHGFHRLHVPYFQGPRDTVALMLRIAGPGETLRIFNTDEFKPPADPEDWDRARIAEPVPQVAPSIEETPRGGQPLKFTSTVLIGGGLTATVHHIPRRITQLPDLSASTPVDIFSSPTVSLPLRSKRVGIEYSGNFWIRSAGLYRFAVVAEDGAKLYIDDQLVDDDDQPHYFQRNRRSCSLWLSEGAHRVRLLFFHASKGRALLALFAARPGEAFRQFTTQDFSPPPGAGEKSTP